MPATIYIAFNGERRGPYTEEEIRVMLGAGQITSQQLAWSTGLSQWVPLDQIISVQTQPPIPGGLPPIPPPTAMPAVSRAGNTKTTIKLTSGILALLFGLLTILCIRGCSTNEEKMKAFEKGSNPADAARMVERTFTEGTQEDPFRGMRGFFQEYSTMKDDRDMYHTLALICFFCAGVSGGAFLYLNKDVKA